MTEKITTTEVLNAVSRLPEEERVCVLELMNIPGLANVLNSEEEYRKVVDKLNYFIDAYKTAISAVTNIKRDIEMQRIMTQRKPKSWRDSINPFKGRGTGNEQSEKQD